MNFTKLENSLSRQLSRLEGIVALKVLFLNDKNQFDYNSTIEFWAASVIKVPTACAFYNMATEQKLDTNQLVNIDKPNYVKGSGLLKLLNRKDKFTYDDLITLMLTISDNTAANQILDYVNPEYVEKYAKSIGLRKTTCRHKMMLKAGKGPNITTAEDMTLLLQKLYNNEVFGSKRILNIMQEQLDRSRVPRLLPNNVAVSYKNGSLPKAMHEIAIVYGKEPFTFCFFSDDQEDKELTNKVLSNCAKICFDYSMR